jgi:hypothetical protein
VIYDHYHVVIAGSIPVRTESGETKLPFRIEDTIDIVAIRSNSSRRAALAAIRSTAAVSDTPTAEDQPVSLPLIRYAEVAA